MNKLIIYLSLIIAVIFTACDAQIDHTDMGNPITADQLNISATPIVVNGKNSNKVVLVNHSPVLSQWDYGLGISHKQADTVLLVVTGNSTIDFTGLNPDGSTVTKELTVKIDDLSFPVPPQWSYLCGTGEKTWVWDETNAGGVWGSGGFLASTGPAWWQVFLADMDAQTPGEGAGSSMVFSLQGASLSKIKSDGTTTKGAFSFDMSKITLDGSGKVWSIGQLTTRNVTVLSGKSPDEGNIPVYTYYILALDDNKLVLSYAPPGTEAWGNAYFWVFRAK